MGQIIQFAQIQNNTIIAMTTKRPVKKSKPVLNFLLRLYLAAIFIRIIFQVPAQAHGALLPKGMEIKIT